MLTVEDSRIAARALYGGAQWQCLQMPRRVQRPKRTIRACCKPGQHVANRDRQDSMLRHSWCGRSPLSCARRRPTGLEMPRGEVLRPARNHLAAAQRRLHRVAVRRPVPRTHCEYSSGPPHSHGRLTGGLQRATVGQTGAAVCSGRRRLGWSGARQRKLQRRKGGLSGLSGPS